MLIRLDWARDEAIRQYRAAAAFHRTLGNELAAGCDHRRQCAGRTCVEAAAHYLMARRCEAQAWLEEHADPRA
jgi:hypothetical protein